jgi:hypothetical protein
MVRRRSADGFPRPARGGDRVRDALGELAPYAADQEVRLALEALHSMDCADRAVFSTVGQALDQAEELPQRQVGVVVDTLQVWWDPDVWRSIERAGVARRVLPGLRMDSAAPGGRPPGPRLQGRRQHRPPAIRHGCRRGRKPGQHRGRDVQRRRMGLPRGQTSSPGSCGASLTWSFPTTLQHEHPPVAPERSAFHLGHHGCTS